MGHEMNHYRELRRTIDLALVAMNELDKAIEKITEGDFSYNMTLSWHHINGILIYTNRVSRILWNKQQESRRTEIRDKLKVNDASPLHYSKRTVRDSFDHVDEQIDRIEKGELSFAGDFNIGNIKTFAGNLKVGDYFRHYDPTTKTIYFADYKFEIIPIKEELIRIHNELTGMGF